MTDTPRFEMGHIAICVTDIDRMADFYSRVLGFKITDGGLLGEYRMAFLSRDAGHHHQIALITGRPARSYNTINHIAFKVSSLDDLRVYYDALAAEGVDGIDPTNHGNAWSIYFRDPEGNRLEVFMDTPWQVEQPQREALDFSLSDDEIHETTKARFGAGASFRPVEEWRAEIAPTIT